MASIIHEGTSEFGFYVFIVDKAHLRSTMNSKGVRKERVEVEVMLSAVSGTGILSSRA